VVVRTATHARADPCRAGNEEATAPVAPSLSGPAIVVVYQHRSGTSPSPAPPENTHAPQQITKAFPHHYRRVPSSVARQREPATLATPVTHAFHYWPASIPDSAATLARIDPHVAPICQTVDVPNTCIVACYFEPCSFAVRPRHQGMSQASKRETSRHVLHGAFLGAGDVAELLTSVFRCFP
jgi:hypothetical protein